MLFPVMPVPEVTFVPFAAYTLAVQNMERNRSLSDGAEFEFVVDISELEAAGLI